MSNKDVQAVSDYLSHVYKNIATQSEQNVNVFFTFRILQ